jgi:hypothetical protein
MPVEVTIPPGARGPPGHCGWVVIKKVVKHFVSLGVGWDCCPGEDESNHHGYERREHAKWLIFSPSEFIAILPSAQESLWYFEDRFKFDLAAR